MLIKRQWSEIRQGDAIYLPGIKERMTYIMTGWIGSPATGEMAINEKWPVMRFEEWIPYFVSVRGVQTGEVLWTRIDR